MTAFDIIAHREAPDLMRALDAARIAAVVADRPRYVYIANGAYTVAMTAPRQTHFHIVRPDGTVATCNFGPARRGVVVGRANA
jgi:hypothetical protein